MNFRKYIIALSVIIAGYTLSGQSVTETFVYDEAGRLIQSTLGDSAVITYQYDLGGNMILRSVEKQTTRVNHVTPSKGIYLLPNPTSEKLNISVPEGAYRDFALKIIDALGRNFIMSQTGTLNYEGATELSLSSLPSGTYILNMIIDQKMYVDKIIKF